MSDFKKTFIKGVAYTAVAKYLGLFISIIISAILARLLCPSDFGLVAIATVVIGFINLITDFGLAPAIVQKDDLTTNDLRSLFSLSLFVGIVASITLLMCAHIVSNYYNNETLVPIVQLLSVNVIFAAANIVPNALLTRAKKFKIIAKRTLLMQMISGIIAVSAAFAGWGLYALVIQSILAAVGVFVFNYYLNPIVPMLRLSTSSVKKVFSFSLVQFVTSIITYVNDTIDKLLVGKMLGLSDLGYYEKSYKLMRMPVSNLSYVFTGVMQPMFKDYKNDIPTMADKYFVLFRFLAIIGLPLSSYLYFEASDLICSFYGMKWLPAVRPFQLFGLSAGLMILLSSTGPIYQASSSLRSQIASCLIETSIGLCCLFVGLTYHNVNIVAAFISFGIVLRFISSFGLIVFCVFRVSFFKFFKEIMWGVAPAVIVFLLLFLVCQQFHGYLSFPRLIINTIILGVVLLIFLLKSKMFNYKKLIEKKYE